MSHITYTSVGKTANFSLVLVWSGPRVKMFRWSGLALVRFALVLVWRWSGPATEQRQDQQRTRPADQTSKSDQQIGPESDENFTEFFSRLFYSHLHKR